MHLLNKNQKAAVPPERYPIINVLDTATFDEIRQFKLITSLTDYQESYMFSNGRYILFTLFLDLKKKKKPKVEKPKEPATYDEDYEQIPPSSATSRPIQTI
jgi:hypothetical protein